MGDHEHMAIKHNDHILLDQPLLRLPYELLRNNFRSAHFTVEKESTGLKTSLKDATTRCFNGKSTQDDLVRNLDDMIAQAKALRRKLAACADEESRLLGQEDARIKHVDDLYSIASFDDVKYETWSRTRLDRLMGMKDLVDVETLVSMNRIRESLKKGSVQEALVWCSQNKKELRKMDGRLEFDLRFQQFVEMLRSGAEPKTCLAHIKKHLMSHNTLFPSEVKAACGMLAFPFDSVSKSAHGYGAYFQASRWDMLANLFTETHNALLSLPSVPLLNVALSSGLSALKTPACHAAARESAGSDGVVHGATILPSGQQTVCPICSPELKDLAMNVPYAHHTKSIVEHDLVVLPNGRVYGKEKLEQHAKKSGLPASQIKDLQTGEVYGEDQLKKVFIT
ncbi:unnamed protein product [Parascedosporium putredinis]|uniref:Protein FYV10 n=1 Tax=Parascedosporium putredinis TaxID=1442378 RepID=A0A9P1M5X9_9PEZI|nr:unnamed protein product [Parascedosporium putredinis]CAI7988641.1 unnamed protein product [Parascedosporium putredinis]